MGVRHPPGSALKESTLGLINHVSRRQATYVWCSVTAIFAEFDNHFCSRRIFRNSAFMDC